MMSLYKRLLSVGIPKLITVLSHSQVSNILYMHSKTTVGLSNSISVICQGGNGDVISEAELKSNIINHAWLYLPNYLDLPHAATDTYGCFLKNITVSNEYMHAGTVLKFHSQRNDAINCIVHGSSPDPESEKNDKQKKRLRWNYLIPPFSHPKH